MVHHVQKLRKGSGLRADDRIRLTIAAPAGIAEAVSEQRAYICSETLAVSLALGEAPAGASVAEATIEGVSVLLGLTRAASPAG